MESKTVDAHPVPGKPLLEVKIEALPRGGARVTVRDLTMDAPWVGVMQEGDDFFLTFGSADARYTMSRPSRRLGEGVDDH